MSRHQRDHSVPTGAKSVHPRGHPMSHSTKSGLSFAAVSRRIEESGWIASVSVVPAWCRDPSGLVLVLFLAPTESIVTGVGQSWGELRGDGVDGGPSGIVEASRGPKGEA